MAFDDENAPLMASVCRRLDGMPLAIELAAARMRSMSLRDLSERLDHRFRLLTGGSRNALPRQQTLRATVDWSHSLLNKPEQVLLRRLSVFSEGFDLRTAEEVCSLEDIDSFQVTDLLGSLVDKNMVMRRAARRRDSVPAPRDHPSVRRRASRRSWRGRGGRLGGGALRSFPGASGGS